MCLLSDCTLDNVRPARLQLPFPFSRSLLSFELISFLSIGYPTRPNIDSLDRAGCPTAPPLLHAAYAHSPNMSLANAATHPSASAVKRSPNDIRVKEASADVINNLLTSLDAFTFPTDSDSYSPLIPNRDASLKSPPASIRPPSSQRPSAPTSIFSRGPSNSFQEDRNPAATSTSSIGEVSVTHVADSPAIKTSRPPSGYSKITAPKPSRKSKGGSTLRGPYTGLPTTTPSSPRPRPEPTLPELPENSTVPAKSIKSKKAADDERRARALTARSQRDSLQVTRSREAKGKQRLAESSPATPLYSPLEPPPGVLQQHGTYERPQSPKPRRLFLSEHVSPAPRSPVRTPKAQDDLPSHRTTSRALRPQESNENFVILHRKRGEEPLAPGDRRNVIPSRSSSVGRTSMSPPKFGRSSRRSSRQSSIRSQRQSPATVPEEQHEDEQATSAGAQESVNGAGPSKPEPELDESNGVMRRIRELRAAKEARDKAKASSLISNSNQLSPPMESHEPTFAKPPDTTRAIKQAQEASHVKGKKVSKRNAHRLSNLEPPPPLRTEAASPTRASFSRPRPTGLDGRPLSPRPASPKRTPASQKPTQFSLFPTVSKESALSRSASRIKRWSNPDLASTRNSYQQRHTRHDSTKTETGTAVKTTAAEENRKSVDSVNEIVQEFLRSAKLSQRISPPDEKRTISFSEVGDPFGHAVFCCIGMGLTRYVMAFYEELATSLKLRLITLERPGIGDSTQYSESRSPLYWPDDIRAICNHLAIQSFSLIAHSAGAIYALATALKMPSRVRGRIHLLAPWIPPSQLAPQSKSESPAGSPARAQVLPRSQRLLRYVPTPLLKLGSSSYGVGKPSNQTSTPRKSSQINSASAAPSGMTSPRPSMGGKKFNDFNTATGFFAMSARPSFDKRYGSFARGFSTPRLEDLVAIPSDHNLSATILSAGRDAVSSPAPNARLRSATNPQESMEWQKRYDAQLTKSIWELATQNANPAVDLLVCLERNGQIGFQYRDVAREIVIRHGAKDSRVPLENVKWLGTQVLQKAEVRVLEGEGHGLMANAGVMASVLAEVSREADFGDFYGKLGSDSTYNSPDMTTNGMVFS